MRHILRGTTTPSGADAFLFPAPCPPPPPIPSSLAPARWSSGRRANLRPQKHPPEEEGFYMPGMGRVPSSPGPEPLSGLLYPATPPSFRESKKRRKANIGSLWPKRDWPSPGCLVVRAQNPPLRRETLSSQKKPRSLAQLRVAFIRGGGWGGGTGIDTSPRSLPPSPPLLLPEANKSFGPSRQNSTNLSQDFSPPEAP